MYIDLGDVVAFLAALGWAGTTVMARYLSRAIPAIWYNALRTGIGTLTIFASMPWWIGESKLDKLDVEVLLLLGVSVFIGYAIGDTSFFESLRRIGVARAATIGGCNPLITAFLAVIFLHEPVTLGLLAGVIVICGGVWIITTDQAAARATRGTHGSLLVGATLALVAAVGWSVSMVMVRPAVEQVDSLLASAIRLPMATAFLFLLATRSRMIDNRRLEMDRRTKAWVLFSGLTSGVSSTLFLWSVDLVGAARTAAISSIVPILSALLAVLLLGERLTIKLCIGMAISVVGVLLIMSSR